MGNSKESTFTDAAIATARAVLTAAITCCLILAMSGFALPALPAPAVRGAAEAQATGAAFESADYRIKDGTGPCIADGVAYLFAGDDPWSPPGVNSSIVALDADDGSLLWQKELEWAGGMGSKARPLYDSGKLYIGCGKTVYCLDTENSGNIAWATNITPAGATLGDSVIISDPVLYSNGAGTKVIVVGDYIYGNYLGLDAASGGIMWIYAMDANTSAIGAPGVDDAGNRLYLPQHTSFGSAVNGKIYCLDVSGSIPAKIWEFKTDYDVAGSMAIDQGKLYFSDFAYGGDISNLYCLEDKGDTASTLWKEQVWGSSGTPLIDPNSNTLYVCGNDYSVGGNHFYAFDMDSGELLWDNPNWGAYNGNCALSPVTGYLYAGSFDTAMWAHNKGLAAMDPYTGSELWYVQQKGGGDPVISGGLVYTTADGRLYAYEEYMPSQFDWYFAEGYTGPGFEEWLCLANPGDKDAKVDITYLYQGEEARTKSYDLPARTRHTLNINDEAGKGKELGMVISSSQPVLAERPMYFSYQNKWDGGSCVAGAAIPSNYWCLAEGYTDPNFDEHICISNPGKEKALVRIRPLFGTGEEMELEVKAGQRVTVSLASENAVERAYSIASDRGVVVERAMYFNYMGLGGHQWDGGHCTMGATLKDIY
jgi:hypothetical protein